MSFLVRGKRRSSRKLEHWFTLDSPRDKDLLACATIDFSSAEQLPASAGIAAVNGNE